MLAIRDKVEYLNPVLFFIDGAFASVAKQSPSVKRGISSRPSGAHPKRAGKRFPTFYFLTPRYKELGQVLNLSS
ncbi:MAG: hypothetical protein AMJ90_08455 [candidate division Zixibacteria bacterium SM23_73_2]|nr:MAG: hypothetical protein AMJ90_08455 [candidate division Zixibacteria bacterium SM23_73_2]